MYKIGISCRKLAQSKKDGIGFYSQELRQALNRNGSVEAVPYCVQLNLKNVVNNYLFKQPFPTTSTNTNDLNLIHVTDYLIPKTKKIPVVVSLHDAVPLQYPQWVRKRWRLLKNTFLRSSVKNVTHVIALTHTVVTDIINFWKINPEKLSVIHPGVSAYWFNHGTKAEQEEVKKKYQIPHKYFLFVGTFQPRKNIQRLILAYKDLPKEIQKEYNLVLIGQKGWATEEILKELTVQTTNIQWLQYVPEKDLPLLYQGAQAFVFPSLYEGFGMPILEAFASSTPVITSNLSAMPEVAGDCALLVNPYSITEIKNALLEMVFNKSLTENLITKGKARASLFTWDLCAKKTLEVYRNYI